MSESFNAARLLMGDSLGFHIIFVMFGLTLPILVSWFELMGIKRKDSRLIDLSKYWSKIMSLLVITGVISGTIIALQMSLVWPGILEFGGEIIGLPFMFETYAFLLEAVFLALYMTTWNNKKISPKLHNTFGWMTAFGAILSAFAITSINGWMNNPSGFMDIDGKFVNISVVQAMFSDVSLVTFAHSMPAYFMSVALIIAGIYSYKILKSKKRKKSDQNNNLNWFVIKKMFYFSLVCLLAIVITADMTGKYLAKHEQVKFAAIELKHITGDHAPLVIGGYSDINDKIKGPRIEIPNALSLLAGNSVNHEVVGLNHFRDSDKPPLYIHTLYSIKLIMVTALSMIIIGFFVIRKWKKQWINKKFVLFSICASGIISTTIMELGWMITEIGRQPWAVRGYVTTEEAFTKTHDITTFGYLFPTAYVLLSIVTILAIKKIIKNNKKTTLKEKE